MNQEDITQIYETLAPMAGDYMNAQAEQIGQAQRSMGPLAANVQGSTTSGLGNYTYNRLMRPQVDVMRDEIRVQGYANQLNRLLSDALNNARNRYNRGGNGGGGNPDTTNPSNDNGTTKIGGVDDVDNSKTPITVINPDGSKSVTYAWDTTPDIIPNSFSYEDAAGVMQTTTRPPLVSNDDWARTYRRVKEEATKNGRRFVNGK